MAFDNIKVISLKKREKMENEIGYKRRVWIKKKQNIPKPMKMTNVVTFMKNNQNLSFY